MKLSILSALFVTSLITGCGAKQPAQPAEPMPASAPDTSGRKTLAQGECERDRGTVVGDIGDGATRRADYVCPSGKPPMGNIAPAPGGPIAVEGNVCCPR